MERVGFCGNICGCHILIIDTCILPNGGWIWEKWEE